MLTVAIGSLCASAMNAASNIVNQIADLEIDRKNKPDRPLVTGEVAIGPAWAMAAFLYALSILPTWWVVPYPHVTFAGRMAAPLHLHAAFFIYCVGALATFVYSFPAFGRSKRHWFWANFTIAVTRGGLLKVAGWSFVASVLHGEAWAHRRHLRPLPAGRHLDEGLLRHGGRPRPRLPHPSGPLRRGPGGEDDGALLRPAVAPDSRVDPWFRATGA